MESRHLGFFSLIVLLVATAALAMAWVFRTTADNQPTHVPTPQPLVTGAPDILPDDPIFGPEDAKVTVTAFMDFGCQSCVTGFERLMQVYNRLPEGTMRIVWKDLPEHGDVVAEYRTAHIAARCSVPHGVFWSYAGTLFAQGPHLTLTTDFTDLAVNLGVPEDAFAACLDARATDIVLDRTTQQAKARGIASTPFFYLNEEPLDGVVSINTLQSLILEQVAAQ